MVERRVLIKPGKKVSTNRDSPGKPALPGQRLARPMRKRYQESAVITERWHQVGSVLREVGKWLSSNLPGMQATKERWQKQAQG